MAIGSPAASIFLSAGLAGTLVLASVAMLGFAPVQRSPILITDSDEPDIPDDYDALQLRGQLDRDVYLVTLVVAGVVQDSRYIVGILVKEDRGDEYGPYVYSLEYQFSEEENYGTPTVREGNTLTFRFPLSQLSRDAFIVGLDANIFGPLDTSWSDNVREGPREALRIHRMIMLPVSPVLLGLTATMAAIATLFGTILIIHHIGWVTRRDL